LARSRSRPTKQKPRKKKKKLGAGAKKKRKDEMGGKKKKRGTTPSQTPKARVGSIWRPKKKKKWIKKKVEKTPGERGGQGGKQDITDRAGRGRGPTGAHQGDRAKKGQQKERKDQATRERKGSVGGPRVDTGASPAFKSKPEKNR